MRVVTEAKESQDKACQVMAHTGLQLTTKLETMSNAQHTMQLDFTKLSTSYSIDRENQSTKKTDSLIPVSDYTILRSLIEELDIVTLREAMIAAFLSAC